MTTESLLWLLILLSALLYDVAFFFPEYLGFFVLPSLGLIFWVLCCANRTGKQYFYYGLAWGMLVFSAHFIWLLALLLDKVQSGKCFAVFAYAFGIVYFSLTSALWFWSVGLIFKKVCRLYLYKNYLSKTIILQKFLIFLVTCYGYFYLLENYALCFLGRIEGYPFLNPLIPLINFKLFTKALILAGILFGRGVDSYDSGVISQNHSSLNGAERAKPGCVEFIYLKPDSCLSNDRSSDQNFVSYEYQIYRKLCDLKLWNRRDENKQFIIFSPESSFPFPLNTHPDVVELWSNVLPDNAHLFIGTQYRLNGKICQAVCWLNMRRIKNFYVKRHCVPFVEKIPRFYKKLKTIQDVFLSRVFPEGVSQFSRVKKFKQQNYFEFNCSTSRDLHASHVLHNEITFIPQICSEMFFVSKYKTFSDIAMANSVDGQDRQQAVQPHSPYIIFFVNDSWFVGYFKEIMQDGARLKALLSGIPLIYVGHDGLKIFK